MAGYFKGEQHKLDIDDKFNDDLDTIEGLIEGLAQNAGVKEEEVLSSAYQALAKAIDINRDDDAVKTVIENAKSRLKAQQSVSQNLQIINETTGKALSEAEVEKAELLKRVILHTSEKIFEDTQEVLDEQQRVLKTTLDPKHNLVNILGPAGSAKTVNGFFPILWAATNGKNVALVAPDDRVGEAKKDFEKKASKHIKGLFDLIKTEAGIDVDGSELQDEIKSCEKAIDNKIKDTQTDPAKRSDLQFYKEILSALKSIASLDQKPSCIKFISPNDYIADGDKYSSILVDETTLIEPEQLNDMLVKVMRDQSRIIMTTGPNQNSVNITPLINPDVLEGSNILVKQQLRNRNDPRIANSLNDEGGINALVRSAIEANQDRTSQFRIEDSKTTDDLSRSAAKAYVDKVKTADDLLNLGKVALITASNNDTRNTELEKEAVKSLKDENILRGKPLYNDSNGVPVYVGSVVRLKKDALDTLTNTNLKKGSRFKVRKLSGSELTLQDANNTSGTLGNLYIIQQDQSICSNLVLSSEEAQGLTCKESVVYAPVGTNEGGTLNGLYVATTRHTTGCSLHVNTNYGSNIINAYSEQSYGSLSQDPDQLTATTNVREEEKTKQQVEQQHTRDNYKLWQSSEIQINPDNSADQILETLNNIHQKGQADYGTAPDTKIIDITRGNETVIHSNDPAISNILEIANNIGVKAAQTAFKQSDVYSRELTPAQTKQVATAIEQFVVEDDGSGGSKLNADKATIAASMLLELQKVTPKFLEKKPTSKKSDNATENRHLQGSLQQAIAQGLENSLRKTMGSDQYLDELLNQRDYFSYGEASGHDDLKNGTKKYVDYTLTALIAIGQVDSNNTVYKTKCGEVKELFSCDAQHKEQIKSLLEKLEENNKIENAENMFAKAERDYLISKAYINFLKNRVADRYNPKNPQGDDPLITDLNQVFKNVIHGANETTIVDPLDAFKQALKGGDRDTILAEASKAHEEKNQSIPHKDFYEPENIAGFLSVNQDILHNPFAENQSSDDLWSVVDLLVAQKQKIAELENEVKTLQQQKKNRDESIGNLEEGLYDVKQELGNAQQRNSNLEEDNKKLIQAAQNSVNITEEMIKTQAEQKKQFKEMKFSRNIAYGCALVGVCVPLVGLALTAMLSANMFAYVSIGVAMICSGTVGGYSWAINRPAIKRAEEANSQTTQGARDIDTELIEAIQTHSSNIPII